MPSFESKPCLVVARPAIKVVTLEDGRARLTVVANGVEMSVTFDNPDEADVVAVGLIGANAIGKALHRRPHLVDSRGDATGAPLYEIPPPPKAPST